MADNSSTNLTQYVPEFKEILRRFMAKETDEHAFISELKKLERKARRELTPKRQKDEGLWFRFFEGDPSATTIRNLEYHFVDGHGGVRNKNYFLECMELALQPETEPKVFFS